MAITIHQTPSSVCSAGNPMIYAFSSNQSAQANFYFKVEVYLDNVKVATNQVFPEVSLNRSHIDVASIIQPRLNKPRLVSNIYENCRYYGNVKIKIFEVYGTPPTDKLSLESGECIAINMSLSNREWEEIDIVNTFQDKRFFTDNPTKEFLIQRGSDVPLYRYENQAFRIYITTFDAQGNQLDALELQEVSSDFVIVGMNFNEVNLTTAGVTDINQVAYFKVAMYNGEEITFRYVNDCHATKYQVNWLNKYGAFDCYAITHNMQLETNTKSFGYEKQYGGWLAGDYVFDRINSGNIDYLKITDTSGTLYTGWLQESIANWMISIINSPCVYLYNGNNDIEYRLQITDKKKPILQDRFDDDLLSFSFEFDINDPQRSINL